MSLPYPIIIVTGANSGVGYGICQRLLLNFCGGDPQDALPQPLVTRSSPIPCEFTPTTRLSLILACRNLKKASIARTELLQFLDKHISQSVRTGLPSSEHMKQFRKNLSIDMLELDLANVSSTFAFCSEIIKTYPYVSHVIFNAGCAPWSGLDWIAAIKQCLFNLRDGVTYPRYKLQTVGVLSDDGLGWAFQSNLFGHFIIYRELQGMLRKSPWVGRVIWTGSLDVEHSLVEIDWNDWQLIKATDVYEASKYQIELVSIILDLEAGARNPPSGHSPIRHLISHPGVTCTNIFASKLNFVTEYLMWLAFMLARILGSQFHPITWVSGAIAATHLALAPLALLAPREKAAVNGARSTLFGKAYVDESVVIQWPENEEHARDLVDRCQELYHKLKLERK